METDQEMEAGLTGIHDLRTFLEGAWEITRSIEDRRNNAPGQLSGRAVFAFEEKGLRYRESGRLMTPSFNDDVKQEYLFEFPEPHFARVSFKDGRAFHDLDMRTGSWETGHACEPDFYEGVFEIKNNDVWRSRWIVRGPRKDMTIRTDYRRTD